MGFEGVGEIAYKFDRHGVDKNSLIKAEVDVSGKSVFDTGRLKFVVDNSEKGIENVAVYGLQPIKTSCNNSEVSALFSDIAERNGIGYSDMTSFFDVGGRRDGVCFSFMATPRVFVDDEIEDCVRKIYAAQNDLIRALSSGGKGAVYRKKMAQDENGCLARNAEEKVGLIKSLSAENSMNKGTVYNVSFRLPGGLMTTVGERLLELGDGGGCSWRSFMG